MNLETFDPQARDIIARYDEPRAAMLPLLWLVQGELGHIPSEAEYWVGRHLGVAVSHVREVPAGLPAGTSRLHESAVCAARS